MKFRIRIEFFVQREIVTGLKYVQKTTKMGMTVDKMTHMVGSYAPKATHHCFTTPPEDAPSGMVGRGSYHVASLFTDDDKHEHLKVINSEKYHSSIENRDASVSDKFIL